MIIKSRKQIYDDVKKYYDVTPLFTQYLDDEFIKVSDISEWLKYKVNTTSNMSDNKCLYLLRIEFMTMVKKK